MGVTDISMNDLDPTKQKNNPQPAPQVTPTNQTTLQMQQLANSANPVVGQTYAGVNSAAVGQREAPAAAPQGMVPPTRAAAPVAPAPAARQQPPVTNPPQPHAEYNGPNPTTLSDVISKVVGALPTMSVGQGSAPSPYAGASWSGVGGMVADAASGVKDAAVSAYNAIPAGKATADTQGPYTSKTEPGYFGGIPSASDIGISKPSSNYVGGGPTDPDTNGRKAAPGVDLRVSAGQLADKVGEGIFGADYQRERTATPTYNPFAVQAPSTTSPVQQPARGGAPTPPAATVAGNPASPAPSAPSAPSAYQQSVLDWKPKGDQYDNAVKLAALSGAQPAAGMPSPASVAPAASPPAAPAAVPDYVRQAAALQERERYAAQLAMQQEALNMANQAEANKLWIAEQIMKNPEFGPATLQALTGLVGGQSGAYQVAGAGMPAIAGMANHAAAIADKPEDRAVTMRGQDTQLAAAKAGHANDRYKADLTAAVAREGQASQRDIYSERAAVDDRRTAAQASAAAAQQALAEKKHQDSLSELKESQFGRGFVDKAGRVYPGMMMVPKKDDPKKNKPAPGMGAPG